MSKTLILIPSRLGAKRLPGKPLLEINKKSIIYHVYKKAVDAKIGKVFVATGDKKIYKNIISQGGKCVLTKKNHKSGTDRIYEAFKQLKLKNIKYVLNIQGDEPLINKNDIINLNKNVIYNNLKFCTLGAKIKDKKKLKDENVVKVVTKHKLNKKGFVEAEKFFRKSKLNELKNVYHHVGIYQFSVSKLKKFVRLNQTKNEKKFKLEQLRALDNNIKINVVLAKTTPLGIDTKSDYKKVKKLMERAT